MKLSLINKRMKGITIGSTIKYEGNYPFGKVFLIEKDKIWCHWYKNLIDLKKDVNREIVFHNDEFYVSKKNAKVVL